MKMQITVNQNIIKSSREEPGIMVGVAQIREANERGRMTKEGAIVAVLKTADATEARVMLNPDEARELGNMLIVASYQGVGVLMPMLVATPPEDVATSLVKQ